MSRTALKKELTRMTREQLEQIILDAYDASKETKAYFEFFLNPDVARLRDRLLDVVCRELRRQKWSYCKARVTVLKKAVRDFASYKPGPQEVIAFMADVLEQIGVADRFLNLSGPQERFADWLGAEIIACGDANFCADLAVDRLNRIINTPEFRVYFRRAVSEVRDRCHII